MTDYIFPVKCIKTYATGGTTYWLKDKIYNCKAMPDSIYRIKSSEIELGCFAFFELSTALFHEHFERVEQADGVLEQCG